MRTVAKTYTGNMEIVLSFYFQRYFSLIPVWKNLESIAAFTDQVSIESTLRSGYPVCNSYEMMPS